MSKLGYRTTIGLSAAFIINLANFAVPAVDRIMGYDKMQSQAELKQLWTRDPLSFSFYILGTPGRDLSYKIFY